jgi:hypothetical protein
MGLTVNGDVVAIEGYCRVEDAEPLVAILQRGKVTVDLTMCEGLHAAVAQAILAFDCQIVGQPTDQFLSELLKPALSRGAKP